MTGKDLLQAMNYLEDAVVEKSMQTTKTTQTMQNKSKFATIMLKWGVVAATVMILLGGGVAYAAKYGIFRINPGWESGYHVDITSRRVTEEEFSEEVRAVKAELLEDIAAADDPENNPAFGWVQDFDTVAESVAFIGHAGLKTPKTPGVLEQTGVTVLGNNQAEILYVDFYARSYLNNKEIGLIETARIYTTTMFLETGAGIKENGLIYDDEIYITASGKEAVIMLPTVYRGNSGIHGYLVDDSVIYQLWITCWEKDHNQALQIMKDWMDQF